MPTITPINQIILCAYTKESQNQLLRTFHLDTKEIARCPYDVSPYQSPLHCGVKITTRAENPIDTLLNTVQKDYLTREKLEVIYTEFNSNIAIVGTTKEKKKYWDNWNNRYKKTDVTIITPESPL